MAPGERNWTCVKARGGENTNDGNKDATSLL